MLRDVPALALPHRITKLKFEMDERVTRSIGESGYSSQKAFEQTETPFGSPRGRLNAFIDRLNCPFYLCIVDSLARPKDVGFVPTLESRSYGPAYTPMLTQVLGL
jgi:hypothetical protein